MFSSALTRIACASVMLAAPWLASTAQSQTLTLRAALSRALAASPRLTAAERDVGIASGQRIQAGTLINPELSYEQDNSFGSGIYRGTRSAETTLQISQLFELWGKREARIAAGAAGVDVAAIQRQAVRLEVLSETAIAFLSVLGLQRRPEIGTGPWLGGHTLEDASRARLQEYDVRPPDPLLKSAKFSGGNQQKIIIAREIKSNPDLLIVGQREEAALGMLGIGLISLATQLPKAGARFLVFDYSAPDSAEAKFLEQIVAIIPHEIRIIRAGDVDETLNALAAEQQARAEQTGAGCPETFLLVHGLQRNKKLKFDEEMSFSLDASTGANPGLQFNKLITEGASLGFHVIATCDSYNNVMRFLSRKAVSEFEMRVVFQMSANDSASLIESPLANDLGLHRAILFNGQEGWTETFRPYALPETIWLETAQAALARLHH